MNDKNNVKLLEPPSPPRTEEPCPALPPESTPPGRLFAFGTWLAQSLPTALVLLALGGLALWGHQTGWTIPKFSTLMGNDPADKEDWCEPHSVPESQCVECNPKLLPRPPSYGWCKRHGVFDCPLEHPDVAQLPNPYRVTRADLDRTQRALDCADRPKNNDKCKLHLRRLQFASQQAMDKAGIEPWFPVCEAEVEETVPVNGVVSYDQTRVSQLSTPVKGRVWRVEATVGKAVKPGDILALVDAAEVGKAKGEFLQALAQVNLKDQALKAMKPAYVSGAIPEAKFREAGAALREAQIRLVSAQQALGNLGLPIRVDDVRDLPPDKLGEQIQFLGLEDLADKVKADPTASANLIPVKAPHAGVVVVRQAGVGELVDASKTLFVVADPGRMWLTLHVRPEALKPFRETDPNLLLQDKTVDFFPDGTRERVKARIVWVSTAVDERTRTLEVRADLVNPGGRLRANVFGAGRIVLRKEKNVLVVPSQAVQWDGHCHVVFVYDKVSPGKDAPKVFHVRSVRPGVQYQGNTEIIAGVLPGEIVVRGGSGVLRAELLKANLGEG